MLCHISSWYFKFYFLPFHHVPRRRTFCLRLCMRLCLYFRLCVALHKYKARQDTTRHDATRRDTTRQDKTRQDKTRQVYSVMAILSFPIIWNGLSCRNKLRDGHDGIHIVLSCPVLSCLVCLVVSCRVVSCRVVSCLVLPCTCARQHKDRSCLVAFAPFLS
jgi:hypothetical protein